jgi:hypothetical protein
MLLQTIDGGHPIELTIVLLPTTLSRDNVHHHINISTTRRLPRVVLTVP